MDFKKVVIFVLLFSSTWAFSNHNPGNDEIDPENNDEVYSSDESDDEHNIEGLRPTTEMPKQPTFDTSIGPISLNFDESSCLEPDQIPQSVRHSIRSLPDDSQLPPPPPVASSRMMKKNEKKTS